MVPNELKAYNQWILWREVIKPDGNRTKLPYSLNGSLASVTDPRTWTNYTTAIEASHRLNMGVGFVLTANDPFAFIDLDDPFKHTTDDQAQQIVSRHQKIMQAFDTYTEVSPSGTGLHLILKGAVEKGRRRDKVEIYSTDRYMTVTGNTLLDKPISDRGYLLQQLWQECGGLNGNGHGETIIEEYEEKFSDRELYEIAAAAENGEKFIQLWQGQWVDAGYKSQSEADFSLINILSFYSRNVTQIKRMFFLSGLGQRDKAKRKTYIDNMVKRSFDNQIPYIPLQVITANLREQLSKSNGNVPTAAEVAEENKFEYTFPQGLLGDIAKFIYESAPRQVKEIAIAGAIGLMGGICGRSYNVSGTGLNQYILVLANTGTGKEAIASGIDKLMRYVRMKVPAAMEYIGPSEIASGQALIKYLSKYPCFLSVVGEFGLALQYLCAPNANTAQIMLRKKLLELYNKSGQQDVLQPTVYSDKEKNIQAIQSPAFSLLGESTPESYYEGLDEGMISYGLLPRFLAIEYKGPRPGLNVAHTSFEPTAQLIDGVAELATNCLTMAQSHRVINVALDPQAQHFADEFERETTYKINHSDVRIAKELWNRAHLKLLKLSALCAIGLNAYEPVITLPILQWALSIIERDINAIFNRFEAGKIGKVTSDLNQIEELRTLISEYIHRPYDDTLRKYMVNQQMHYDHVVPYSYMQRRISNKSCFRHDRTGATMALKRSLDSLIMDGALREMRAMDCHTKYGSSAKCYYISDLTRF